MNSAQVFQNGSKSFFESGSKWYFSTWLYITATRIRIIHLLKMDKIYQLFKVDQNIIIWYPRKLKAEIHPHKYFLSDQNNYVDSNPAFHIYTDIDYDFECGGISRVSFIQFYGSWISYVYKKIKKVDLDLSTASMSNDDESIESNIFTLCFALSLMGRKALASASHQGHGAQEPVRIELFLHGLHSLFQVSFF